MSKSKHRIDAYGITWSSDGPGLWRHPDGTELRFVRGRKSQTGNFWSLEKDGRVRSFARLIDGIDAYARDYRLAFLARKAKVVA
jgi:hypothetical protein